MGVFDAIGGWAQQNPYAVNALSSTLGSIGSGMVGHGNDTRDIFRGISGALAQNQQAQQGYLTEQQQARATQAELAAEQEKQNQTIEWLQNNGFEQYAGLPADLGFKLAMQDMAGGGQPSSVEEYQFYANEEMKAGRAPVSFMEYQQQAGQSGGGGLGTTIYTGRDAQGNVVPMQVGSNGSFVTTQMPDGVTFDPGALNMARSAGSTFGKEVGAAQFDLPNARLTAEQTIEAIDALRVIPDPSNPEARPHPGADEAFGVFGIGGVGIPQQWTPALPGTRKMDFQIAREQLQGKIFLQAYEMLRGGGQITEVEGRKAEQAMARINQAGTREEFQRALDDLKQAVIDGYNKLVAQSQGTMAVPGFGTAPAQQPLTGTTSTGLGWSVTP